MFEEVQLFVSQNQEVLYGQKYMRRKMVACFRQFSFSWFGFIIKKETCKEFLVLKN